MDFEISNWTLKKIPPFLSSELQILAFSNRLTRRGPPASRPIPKKWSIIQLHTLYSILALTYPHWIYAPTPTFVSYLFSPFTKQPTLIGEWTLLLLLRRAEAGAAWFCAYSRHFRRKLATWNSHAGPVKLQIVSFCLMLFGWFLAFPSTIWWLTIFFIVQLCSYSAPRRWKPLCCVCCSAADCAVLLFLIPNIGLNLRGNLRYSLGKNFQQRITKLLKQNHRHYKKTLFLINSLRNIAKKFNY